MRMWLDAISSLVFKWNIFWSLLGEACFPLFMIHSCFLNDSIVCVCQKIWCQDQRTCNHVRWLMHFFMHASFPNIQLSSHFFWLKQTYNPKLIPCFGVNVRVFDLWISWLDVSSCFYGSAGHLLSEMDLHCSVVENISDLT